MKYIKLSFLIFLGLIIIIIACTDGAVPNEKEDDVKYLLPSWGINQWAKRLGNNYNDYGNAIKTDSSGNIFVVGSVPGDADMNGDGDYTDGEAESSSGYGASDVFLIKFNASGVYQWSKRFGGGWGDYIYGITIDSNDNIFLTGTVYGNADLNGDRDSSDGGGESSAGYGDDDIYIIKLNSSGVYQWSKRVGGTDIDSGKSIAVDSSGNAYLTGIINGNADLNGDGDSMDGGAELSSGYGEDDIFIVKFDASGTFQWAKRLGGAVSDAGNSITVDSTGNVYATGYINGNADLNGDGDSIDGGGEPSSGYGNRDVFIVKFNSSGTYQSSIRLGGVLGDYGSGIISDPGDNIYIVGQVVNNADLNGDGDSMDGGAESVTGYGNGDTFVVKFNTSGVYQWSKRVGGTDLDSGICIAVNSDGNVFIAGNVIGNADLNGDGDSLDGSAETAAGYGSDDVFVVKLNSSGNFLWAKRFGGVNIDEVNGISVYSNTNVYITGYVTGNADLNGDGDSSDSGAESTAGYGLNDTFIIKIQN